MKNYPSDWTTHLTQAITSIDELYSVLELEPGSLNKNNAELLQQFPLRVPRSFVARMGKKNPQDPLLLQVLPQMRELQKIPGFDEDPLQEKKKNPGVGLLHKYHGRVLLILSGTCAINCRFCFRRHFPYSENNPGMEGWQHVFNYIRDNQSIEEVIFSGGDPLIIKDNLLQQLINQVAAIPHVKRLRIHSRLPIVIPERITTDLVTCLKQTRLQVVLVIHCNHPQELDENVFTAMEKLRESRITLLNQAVLLKGINDSSNVLIELSQRLFANGILPYYLHLLDPVHGAAHFEVPENSAKILVWEMLQKLPGYLVPKLVREVAGMTTKMPISITPE